MCGLEDLCYITVLLLFVNEHAEMKATYCQDINHPNVIAGDCACSLMIGKEHSTLQFLILVLVNCMHHII